jgi:hypothetical protein
MSTGRVQDPEGAKTIILSYKIVACAVATIHRQNLKIVRFVDNNTGRLGVDKHATSGGKQDPSMQGKRMVLIYNTIMHSGSSLNPTQCTQRSDRNARQRWLITTLQQLEQYKPTADPPPPLNIDAEMEEQEQEQEQEQLPEQHGIHAPLQQDHPPTGGNQQIHTGTTRPIVEGTLPQGETGAPVEVTRLSFGTPAPPTILYARGLAAVASGGTLPLQNRFEPLGDQACVSSGRYNEPLSSCILREGSASASSSARGSRGREPIPLTPEILHLLDRLEPDKGKQARLLTEHLTGQRSLPSTETELQTHLERRAARELRRQHVAAEAAANKATEDQDKADHEAAMAAHMAQQAMAAALAA